MTARLIGILATCVLLLCGCGTGWTDHKEGNDPMSAKDALKVEVPASASSVIAEIDPYRIQFLMPNDQWRDYASKYPLDQFEEVPYPTEYVVPAMCLPVARTGVKLTSWIAGDLIQYLDTGQRAHRSITVTPDCESGKAYVQWGLNTPQ
ncbi:Uncharacterised protein [Mycobacteroides abscessus subsp. abscessus]|uniref:hypothetical protein n=1 Tax=Mycobacteroides abscessus TaxID=36809 RepID=UPI00092C61AA|nr:hypothetical protein [Mycobacteroides abscessus]SHS97040.1 Uncharacterised protein [Mycobacteroides abscessus subsp. abscessus]SLK65535.1 Uncharacterised protein [Mycobacteroides abscessus subsp. abscessus]